MYELETSIGNITCKLPTSVIVAEAWALTDNMESNKYVILNCVVEPNLKDKALLDAYECSTPLDIVACIFQPGEISRIATVLMNLAGFNTNISHKLIKTVKKQ